MNINSSVIKKNKRVKVFYEQFENSKIKLVEFYGVIIRKKKRLNNFLLKLRLNFNSEIVLLTINTSSSSLLYVGI